MTLSSVLFFSLPLILKYRETLMLERVRGSCYNFTTSVKAFKLAGGSHPYGSLIQQLNPSGRVGKVIKPVPAPIPVAHFVHSQEDALSPYL